MPQEETDLFEGRVSGEVVNVVAGVRKHTVGAVEVADRRRRRDDTLESPLRCGRSYVHRVPGLGR